MGILIADNFNYKGKKPLDERIVYNLLSDMKAVTDSIIYEGAIAYCKEDKKFYTFDPANTVDATTGKWRELQLGGSGNVSIEEYVNNTNYKKDTLVYLNDRISRVVADYTSANLANVKDSWEDDIYNKKIIPVNGVNIKEWEEDSTYEESDIIIGPGGELGIVLIGPITVPNNLSHSQLIAEWRPHVLNHEIIIIGENEIVLYYRGSRYYNNQIIRDQLTDDLYLALQDFEADQTITNYEANLQDSIDKGYLKLINNVKERIKSNTKLTNTIGSTTTIAIANLPSTTINDIKKNQLVYDIDGTVGFVSSIDTTNNEVTVITITKSGDNKTIRYESDVILDKTILKQTTINFTDLNTLYTVSDLKENQLVYDAEGTIAKIDSINTTPTGTTIDITTLTTSSENFEMRYYKYDKDLDRNINQNQLLSFADINATTINDLEVNQIIFDEKGTISKIENIDTTNNEVTVRIISIDTIVTPIKSYKVVDTLNTAINSQQLINVPTGLNIADIEVEQLVYDDYGTVSKIVSIDTTNNQLMVQTITGLGMPIAPNHKEAKIKKGGTGYTVNDIIETLTSGVFVKVTQVDANGTILNVLVDETATSASTTSGTNAEISYEQVIYGGYGNNWYQLADAAVMVAQAIAETFDFIKGYEYTITSAGTGYAVNDIVEIDTNVFVKVIEVGTSGEIVKVAYTREDAQNTSGTGATITYTNSDDVFIIPGDRWNIGTAMFTLVNDKGAQVQFLRTEQNLVKYSMGEDGLYKFTFDNVDGIIYQEVSKISGSGDATLTEDVKSNLDVGNIKVNDLFKTGTTFTDFVKKLLIKEILPTGKIIAANSGLNLKGSTVTTPLITATILNAGTCTIDKIEFYRGTTLENTQNYITGTNTYTYNTTDITSNETVSIKIYYTPKDITQTVTPLTYSANYRFVNNSYSGVLSNIPTATDIVTLSQNLKETRAFTGTFSPTNEYMVYAYPASFGNLTSIKDQNNFEYIASYTKVTLTVNGENYLVYYRSNKITATGLKQIYS